MKWLVAALLTVGAAGQDAAPEEKECRDDADYAGFTDEQSHVREFRSEQEVNATVAALQPGEVLVLKNYLNWCGYCHSFITSVRYFSLAATNDAFVEELRDHGYDMPSVKVGAINCACEDGTHCNYHGFPRFHIFYHNDSEPHEFEFKRELARPYVKGRDDCKQASSMIYGLLGEAEHNNSIIFNAAEKFAFCETAEVEEKRPNRRWPDSANHWSEHDAKLSLLGALKDVQTKLETTDDDLILTVQG